MTKGILSLDIKKQYLHKVSFENVLSTYYTCFPAPDAALPQYNEKIEKSYWTKVTNTSPYIKHNPS